MMCKIIVAQICIARPIISMDNTTRFNNSFNKGQKAVTGGILKVPQAYSSDAFVAFILNSNTNQCLSSSASPTLAGFFTANVALVNLYCAVQAISPRPDHRTT